MPFSRAVARYFIIALLGLPLVMHLWFDYQLRKILAPSAGIALGQYVAPSWHRLASRVRSGDVMLSREEQAARLDRIAGVFDSEARYEQETAADAVRGAQLLFYASLGVLLIQLSVGVCFGIAAVRKEQHARPPAA
jgi:hypothetical protein